MAEKRQSFDCAVIGSGPGGYPAAIKAAQNGLSVALIESGDLGGTCLNRGCIPSKALIASARIYDKIRRSEEFGITVEKVSFDYAKMVDRANTVVKNIRTSLTGLLKANGITIFKGFGKFVSPREIKVIGEDNAMIEAKQTIIASGSEPRLIPAFPCDYKTIHDSTSLLQLKKLPKKLIIIGGGVIGCEFASMYNLLGVDIEIVEMLPRILSTECQELSDVLTKSLEKRGVKIYTGVTVEAVESGVQVKLQGGKVLKADMALVSVGRKVNTDDIGLEAAGIKLKENGAISVDECMRTGVDGIYAIGDVTAKWWLAHVATHNGLVAASQVAGIPMRMHENAIPSVVFTDPEIASVGMSPEQAEKHGVQIRVGSYPFKALGKSHAIGHTDGFAQVVSEAHSGQILGAQIAGHEAATLISEMALAVANELTLDCVVDTIHAHPTTPEAWMEAALLARGTPIHFPPKKKRERHVTSGTV
ncbi:MAG: Dihydrolipoyl dehydrogenase [Chlamydiae bacterium]|nr:Dihydrolipoyl dehydrogenase [Chlamydiota bacterium]